MARSDRTLRASALLGTGALGVHGGRYLLAFGSKSSEVLAEQGHAYLDSLTPVAGALLAVCLVQALHRWAARRPVAAPRLTGWAYAASFAAILLFAYTAQELAEGELAAGHPSGLAGVFGSGGWLAVPLALLAGPLLAFLARSVDAELEVDAQRTRAPRLQLRCGPAIALVAEPSTRPPGRRASRRLGPRGPPIPVV